MARQTLFRQQRNIEALHKITASMEGGRKNKFNYLKAHRPDLIRTLRGFAPAERGMGWFPLESNRLHRGSSGKGH